MLQNLNTLGTLSVIICPMRRIFRVKYAICLFVLTCFFVVLVHVHLMLKLPFLEVSVFVFMVLRYGSSLYNWFKSCYNKCMKLFFGYHKYSSVTSMLLDVQLPSFDMLNSQMILLNQIKGSSNIIIKHLSELST